MRVSDATAKPVWDLQLFDEANAHVGGLRLAAHDGNVLSVNGLTPGRPTAARPPALVSSADHDSVTPTRVSPSRNSTTTTTTTTYTTLRPDPPPRVSDDGDPRETSSAASSDEGGFFSRAGRTLDHTTNVVGDTVTHAGQSVDRSVRHAGARVQRFFTGGDSSD